MYSFPSLEPVCCSMSSSNCCFLNCIQVSQEAGQVVWLQTCIQSVLVPSLPLLTSLRPPSITVKSHPSSTMKPVASGLHVLLHHPLFQLSNLLPLLIIALHIPCPFTLKAFAQHCFLLLEGFVQVSLLSKICQAPSPKHLCFISLCSLVHVFSLVLFIIRLFC